MIENNYPDIVGKVLEAVGKRIKRYPCDVNRASQIGFPCERELTYERLNWQEKILPKPRVQLIFDIGNNIEAIAIKWLTEAGFQVFAQQTPFEDAKAQIRGSIDTKIRYGDKGKMYPCEIKSMSPFVFEKVNTIEDMTRSSYIYLQKYPAQLQTYLFLTAEQEGLFLLVNKSTGEIKPIWCAIDIDYVDGLIHKAERINKAVSKKELPERIAYDCDICDDCPFVHVCLPDTKQEALVLDDNPILLDLLKRRDALKESASEFEEVKDKIKDMVKDRPKVACGDWLIIGKNISKTKYDYPEDIKKQYAKKEPEWRITIKKLCDEGVTTQEKAALRI
jgi:hypothetical protein